MTRVALAASALYLASSCVPLVRYVDIDSKPSGATIFVDGEKQGVTHTSKLKLDFSTDPNRRVLIQLVKPRYRPVLQYWSYAEVPAEKKVFQMEVD